MYGNCYICRQTYEIMEILQNIKEIVTKNSPEKALEKLEPIIEGLRDSDNFNSGCEAPLAAALAEKGKLLWKLGEKASAISCYEASAQTDPDGPGELLLEHSRKIMDFFDPNQLNP